MIIGGTARFSNRARLAAVLILVASPCAKSQTQGAATARPLIEDARAAVVAGKPDTAVEKYRAAEKRAPSDVKLKMELAGLLARTHRLPDAIEEYRAALQLSPSNEAAALGLADAYRKVFNYEEARRVLQRASQAHPRSAAPRLALAELAIQLQNYDDAISHLKRALALAPRNAIAHRDLGICYRAKGDADQALVEFNAAVRGDAKDPSSYYFRGSLFADRNDNQRAAADARKVLTLEPGNAPATVLLGKVLLRSGDCAAAVNLLAPLRSSASADSEALFQLARGYECLHQPQQARAVRSEFDQKSAGDETNRAGKMDADHLAQRASELARSNQVQPALDLLAQALKKDPQNGAAHALMAKIQFSAGDIARARDEIQSALHTNPYHPEYLYVLGVVLERQGDTPGALEAFHRAVLIDPREADAYYEMAKIYSRSGDRAKARAAIDNALKIMPSDPDYNRAKQQLNQ